jgi:hypothetical protein
MSLRKARFLWTQKVLAKKKKDISYFINIKRSLYFINIEFFCSSKATIKKLNRESTG